MRNRHAIAGWALAAMALAACGDSTAPRPVTAAQLARHLDSLAAQATTATGNTASARYSFFTVAELAPANGAAPVSLTVTTRSGPHTWQGFVVKLGDSLAVPVLDSLFVLFAYSDYSMTTFLFAQTEFYHGVQPIPQIWLVSDTTIASAGTGAGSGTNTFGTVASTSGCALISGLKEYYWSTSLRCSLATFNAGALWIIPNAAGETADFGTVTITPQQFNGVILY